MPQRVGGARVRVVFNERAWREDLLRASQEGRRIARAARQELERTGVAREQLMSCKAEGPGGTELPGCQKLYVGRQKIESCCDGGCPSVADCGAVDARERSEIPRLVRLGWPTAD
jgi:hypothetical protein